MNTRIRKLRVLLVAALLLCAAALSGCRTASPNSGEHPTTDSPAQTASPVAITTQAPPADALPAEALPDIGEFAILFVNAGRADAAILRFGDRTAIIDTGTKASAPQLIAGLNLLGVSAVDAVFLTHSHSDHIGGIAALAANYDIGMVYSPLLSEQNKDGVGKIVARCEKLGLPHTELSAGDSVSIADGVAFGVLGPLVFDEAEDNENSLVLRFAVGRTVFLFTGDMELREEATLLSAGVDLSADVLKVANHGNPDATSDTFAKAVSPDIAIIPTDTREDADSANARVIAALSPAAIHLTEDFPIGALLTLDKDGLPVVSNPAPEQTGASLSIISVDATTQTVVLRNDGQAPLDLSGYILYADRSDAVLRFPDGAALGAGKTTTVSVSGGDYAFPDEDKPLNAKKENTVTLYDPSGEIVATLTR